MDVKAEEAAGHLPAKGLLGERPSVQLLVRGAQKGDGGTPMFESLSKRDRVRKYGEVFTPPEVVSRMCDLLEEESPGAFAIEKTFLEPTCGDGAFVVEILRRKFERCRSRRDFRLALESVYGFEIQSDNVVACIENIVTMCREYFKPTKEEMTIINDHIIQCDGLKVMKLIAHMNEREATAWKRMT